MSEQNARLMAIGAVSRSYPFTLRGGVEGVDMEGVVIAGAGR